MKATPTYYRKAYYILFFMAALSTHQMTGQTIEKEKKRTFISTFDSLYSKACCDPLTTANKRKLLHLAFEANQFTQNDSIKFWNLSKLSVLASELGDSVQFKKFAAASLKLAQGYNNHQFLGDVYWNYGYYHLDHKRYDSAYTFYHKAYKSFNQVPHRYYQAKMLYNMAFINAQIKDFTTAEQQLFQAAEIFQDENRFKQLYLVYNLLGTISDDLEEYQEALKFYSIAAKTLKDFPDKDHFRGEVSNNIGVIHQKIEQHSTAIDFFNKGLSDTSLFLEQPLLYAKLLDNRAYSTYLFSSALNVLDNFKLAQRIRDSLKDDAGSVISRIHQAYFYSRSGDTLTAITLAKEAFNIAQKSNLNRDVLKTLEMLSNLDQEFSNQYLRQHILLNKELYEKERKVREKFMRIRFETDNYISENQRLFRERIWIVSGAAFIGLFLLLLYINSRYRAKNKALLFEKEQQQYNEDMFLLALENKTTLERGRNLERLRISEELHDGILAKLFSVRFKWPFINLSGTLDNLNQHQKSIEQLTDIETEIRNISHDLRNELIWEEMAFIDEVENTIKEKSEFGNFKYSFNCENISEWESLDYLKKINCSRMFDEIFQNTLTHAAATMVHVNLYREENLLVIKVEDNGRGFRPHSSKKGIGLKNLKNRTEKINGKATIESQLGHGTSIVIKFPK